ncbi:hypothetical protein [Carnobacterium sp. TMP28]|uniref:hypothetical protein n=1 Tax=Carnobacterium sp. TMP28 TaxID=3397060 RepID=UPI0039E10828
MKENKLVEIWGDVVAIRSLVLAISFSSFSTMGAFFLAPADDKTKQLFFGLVGALIGFIVSSVVIKPKRVITDAVEANEQHLTQQGVNDE